MKLWQFLSVILILSISPLEISGQNNSGIVSGSVFNSGQEPLVGVSVFVKGTNIGTMTDADGRFSVKAEDGQSLEFRYIGYDTKVVTVPVVETAESLLISILLPSVNHTVR